MIPYNFMGLFLRFCLFSFLHIFLLQNGMGDAWHPFRIGKYTFSSKTKELTRSIQVYPKFLPDLENLEGFYGMIGPDVSIKNVHSLFDLFIGDGIIQGVFFNKGNLTFVKRYVHTEKLRYEENYGKLPEHILHKVLFLTMSTMGWMPNTMGVANTAMLSIKNKTFALYERDSPYQICIDLENQEVSTLGKTPIAPLQSFSAHSKYSRANGIHTLDYHVLQKKANYYQLYDDFTICDRIAIPTKYLPIVHDFYVWNQSCVLADCPILIEPWNVLQNRLPVVFDKTKPTLFYVVNTTDHSIETYTCDQSFYLFHFAEVFENKDTIEIYACLYDHLDFSHLDIEGRYRKLVLEKATKTVQLYKTKALERYNLDFPIRFEDKTIFRNIENKRINGFVICKQLDIVITIFFDDLSLCGEPAVVPIQETPYLLAFANNMNETESFLIMIHLRTFAVSTIPMGNFSVQLGFHSIYEPKHIPF